MSRLYAGAMHPDRADATMGDVPNQPKTPNRSFRIADDIYYPAREKAAAEGRTLTDVVTEALLDYIDED